MQKFLPIIQISSAILIMITILLQNRGTGIGGVFGGEGNVFRTKRGIEKMIFNATIILAIIFLGSTFLQTIYK